MIETRVRSTSTVDGSVVIGNPVISGTPGSVLFIDVNGNLGQDNANLYWDDALNRLGIGTSAPSVALDVLGTSILLEGNAQVTLASRTAGTINPLINLQRAKGDLTTPTAVVNTDILGEIRFQGYNSSSYTNSGALIRSRAVETFTGLTNSGNLTLETTPTGSTVAIERIGISGQGVVVFNETAQDSDVRMEGQTRSNLFFLDASTDRIGINTSSPNGKLEITGETGASDILLYWGGETSSVTPIDANFTTKLSANGQVFRLFALIDPQAAITNAYGLNNSVGIGGSSSNNITNLYAKFVQPRILGSYSGTISTFYGFYCTDIVNTSSGTPAITTQIGIEIANLTFGSTKIALRTQGGGGVIFNEAATNADVRMEGQTDANLFFSDASADFVGIGTNAPTSKLHVVGSILSSATITANGSLYGNNDGVVNKEFKITGSNGASLIYVETNNNRVGINNNAPGSTFDIRGATVFNEVAQDLDWRMEGQTNANLFFLDASTDRIGIGTSLPATIFHVSGGISRFENSTEYLDIIPNSPVNYVRLTTTATSHLELESGGHIDIDVASGSDYIAFQAAGAEIARIAGNGALTITGASDLQAAVSNSTGNLTLADTVDISVGGETLTISPNNPTNYVKLSTAATSHLELESGGQIDFDLAGAADIFRFLAGNVQKARIYGDGAIETGAGTTTPGPARLALKGGTGTVAGNWSLSAGWGASASITAVTGNDSRGTVTVTTNAADTPTANPTITLTFPDGTWTSTPFGLANMDHASTGPSTVPVTNQTSATTLVISYRGTPTATSALTYKFNYIVIG